MTVGGLVGSVVFVGAGVNVIDGIGGIVAVGVGVMDVSVKDSVLDNPLKLPLPHASICQAYAPVVVRL